MADEGRSGSVLRSDAITARRKGSGSRHAEFSCCKPRVYFQQTTDKDRFACKARHSPLRLATWNAATQGDLLAGVWLTAKLAMHSLGASDVILTS